MDLVILGLVASLLFSAFFSGTEIAFFSSNKLAIELGREHSRAGRILGFFVKNTSHFIGTLLIGNNIALVIFGLLAARLLQDPLAGVLPNEFLVLVVQTLITTMVVLLFGEFLPKTLFRIHPLGILRFFALPLMALYVFLYILVEGTVRLSNILLRRILRVDLQQQPAAFGRIDLVHFLEQRAGHPEEEGSLEIDTGLIENVLDLKEVKVRECMVPRPDVEAVGINATISDLQQRFVETGYSRLPVYFQSLDNILGYVHHFELLSRPRNIGSIIMTIPVVPETMTARDLLNLFRRETKSIAWVVDEFGGTAGIVTMEDVLEELFGEIVDEHDDEDLLEQVVGEDEYIFSARLEIDYLNEKYGLQIPEGEYETLAGYIVNRTESIPDMNEKIRLDRFEFDVLHASEKRIETIRIRVVED